MRIEAAYEVVKDLRWRLYVKFQRNFDLSILFLLYTFSPKHDLDFSAYIPCDVFAASRIELEDSSCHARASQRAGEPRCRLCPRGRHMDL